MYIKNNRTFDTLIPNLSANRDETANPCFSKKCRMEWIQFINNKNLPQYSNL